MPKIRHIIRKRIESNLDVRPQFNELLRSEWNKDFERLMRNRRLCAAFRYHPEKVRCEHGNNIVMAMFHCLEKYRRTKNLEFIVDLAAYAMTEFEHPSLEGAKFVATDDKDHYEN